MDGPTSSSEVAMYNTTYMQVEAEELVRRKYQDQSEKVAG